MRLPELNSILTILEPLKDQLYERYKKAYIVRYIIYTSDAIMKKIIHMPDSGIKWFLEDNLFNIELIELYYIICFCISDKFILDQPVLKLYSDPIGGYSMFVKNKALRTKNYYKSYELEVLTLINYEIPHLKFDWGADFQNSSK